MDIKEGGGGAGRLQHSELSVAAHLLSLSSLPTNGMQRTSVIQDEMGLGEDRTSRTDGWMMDDG